MSALSENFPRTNSHPGLYFLESSSMCFDFTFTEKGSREVQPLGRKIATRGTPELKRFVV